MDPQYLDPRVAPANDAQVEAVRRLLGLAGGTLALGAGARGVVGLGNFLHRNLVGPPRTPQRQSFVRIPVPVEVDDEQPEKMASHDKLADAAQEFASGMGLLRKPGEAVGWLRNNLGGWGQGDLKQMPWAYPAAAAAGIGGLYGGWKLTDYLLDKTRSTEQESELDTARRDYERALASRYKTASAPTALDRLADTAEKQGLWNEAMGTALLAGTTLAGLSGLATYNWARGRSRAKAIEEAVRRRQSQLAEQAPNPVMAVPIPVPFRREKTGHIGQAADQWLNRRRAEQMQVWERLMTPPDARNKAEAKRPEGPVQPQLPTLAGTWSRATGRPMTPPQPQPVA
jgi:hypothetical protein